jgi:predicted P-loop ATPase
LINLDEYDSISVRHQPFLKHLLQKPVVNTRRPYKTSVSSMKRFGVFIGTCNNKDLLADPTGSRRYLCIEVVGLIDNKRLIPYEQLYAQAVAALRNSERYWFNSEEEKEILRANTAFEQASIEEQSLVYYFAPANAADENSEWLPTVEIIKRLQQFSKHKFSQVHARNFGRILRKNQFPTKHTREGNLYCLKQRDEG